MVSKTTTIAGVQVYKIGHGCMTMTFRTSPISDEQAFETLIYGIERLPPRTKMFLNTGEFYGRNPREANLELLARFFEKYPEHAEKTYLSVKGAMSEDLSKPSGDEAGIRRSVDNILAKLRGTKRMDLFQCARVDPTVPIEETMKYMAQLIKEGKFDHIGMSECRAETMKRAHAVHPVAAVEIEVSPWNYEDKTQDVIAAAGELGICVVGYSPMGYGFLSGQIKSLDDIPETDYRRMMTRFQPENFEHNLLLVDAIKAIAQKKKVTPAQLCIAWVSHLGKHVMPLPGFSAKERAMENLGAADVELSEAEVTEITETVQNHGVKGERGSARRNMHLWG